MRIETKTEGGALVVWLRDSRLGADVASEFKKEVTGHLAPGVRIVLLEMSQVNFVDSTGLGALVAIRKQLGNGGMLGVCGAQQILMEFFELTRLDKIFQFFPSVESGVAELPVEGARQ